MLFWFDNDTSCKLAAAVHFIFFTGHRRRPRNRFEDYGWCKMYLKSMTANSWKKNAFYRRKIIPDSKEIASCLAMTEVCEASQWEARLTPSVIARRNDEAICLLRCDSLPHIPCNPICWQVMDFGCLLGYWSGTSVSLIPVREDTNQGMSLPHIPCNPLIQ